MAHLHRQGHVLRRLAPRFQAIEVPRSKEEATRVIRSPFYDSIDVLERLLNDTAREIASKVGILSLSYRPDSLPMWAHYARNATGLLIEFAGLEEVFKGDDTGVLGIPVDVRYDQEHLGVTFDPASHDSLFFGNSEPQP